jgi:hypothetical protein
MLVTRGHHLDMSGCAWTFDYTDKLYIYILVYENV